LGARASTAEGSPAGLVGGGGSSLELLANVEGGKTGRRRRSPMRWLLRTLAVSYVGVGKRRKLRRRYTQRKRWQGGARVSAHHGGGHDGGGGRSSGNGERVVRGGSWLRSKTWWCGDAGEAAVRWPYRWWSRAQPSGEARSDSRDGGVQTRAVGRRSNSEAAAQLGQRRGAVGTALSASAFMARHGRGCGCVAATWKWHANGRA
jgi:hypothetical protein